MLGLSLGFQISFFHCFIWFHCYGGSVVSLLKKSLFKANQDKFLYQLKCEAKETDDSINSSKFVKTNTLSFRSGVIEEDQKKKSIFIKWVDDFIIVFGELEFKGVNHYGKQE